MYLMFSGAIVTLEDFAGLTVREEKPLRIGQTWHHVLLQPEGAIIVYASASRLKAERYVTEVQKALKRGISCGAEWIDFSRLPGYVEVGAVTLRGCDE